MIKTVGYQPLIPISICVTDICQLKCEYCFQTSHTLSFLSKEKLDIILNQLRHIVHDIQITLMGGEPSLYPYLNYMLDELNKIKAVKEILFFTNGLKTLSKTHFNKKLHITFSYHVTQNNKGAIIKNLDFLKTNNIPIKYDINAMMVPGKHLEIEEFKKYCAVKPLYIETKHEVCFYNSCPELYDLKDIDYDGNLISVKEFLSKPRNFKGKKCFSAEYDIELNLLISNKCIGDSIPIDQFANFINKHSYIICPFEKCIVQACGGLFIE